MTPEVCEGLQSIDEIVPASPQWWMLEVFDGFGVHLLRFEAMQKFHDSKILSMKEKGNSSDVNQAYDKFVAKNDKAAQADCVSMMHSTRKSPFQIADQWWLLLCGMYAVQATTNECWTKSFKARNMDPKSCVTSEKWCKKISSYLCNGEAGFKNEEEAIIDTYSLLQLFWHAMLPEEKKLVQSVVADFNGQYTVKCCKALREECHIPLKELHGIRLCLTRAGESPDHLERGVAAETYVPPVNNKVVEARADRGDIHHGWNSFC